MDLASHLITIMPPTGASLYFNIQAGSATAVPSGISRKRDFRVQLLNEELDPCTTGNPAFLTLVDADGQKIRFSVETGAVVSMTSASGKVVHADDYFQSVKNTYDDAGNLVSSYTAVEGLMRARTGEAGALIMEWYAPSAVTVLEDGGYEVSGSPYKTSSYKSYESEGVRTTVITRQQRGLPAHTITRREEPGKVTITKGTGDDTIIRTIETNRLYGGMVERIESIRGINDVEPVSCNRSVKQYTDGGWLTVSETEAFRTPLARITTYEYNSEYHVSRVNRPDGGYTRYEYDDEGRVILKAEPWVGGKEKIIRTTYADKRFYDNRPVRVTKSYLQANGVEVTLSTEVYEYEDSPLVEKVTKTVTAASSSQKQISMEETYGEAAAYPYAAGRMKFTQNMAGIQAWYEYEAAEEYGAAHKCTIITKVNAELVPGQSTKEESFIASDDTVISERKFIWDGHVWLLLSSSSYEYDEERRCIKTTHGNGRISTATWMCCGKLSETDEDGVITNYGYNSAHQLVETIRSEVHDGDTVVTPETIVTYIRDAVDRILQTRRDVGSMTTMESNEYDALGRTISQTDTLGRMTTTVYEDNGLTETVTIPAGAVFVTERHPDGSVLHDYGTGQRELYHVYDMNRNCLRETVMLADKSSIVSQTLVNGFGQSVVQMTPTTVGFLYDRSEYDEKGRLIRTQRDSGTHEGAVSMAPTLYEYDSFGNVTRQALALVEDPGPTNSPVQKYSYSVENTDEGVFQVTVITRYNIQGAPLTSISKQLISRMSSLLVSKSVNINERNLTSAEWEEYAENAKRIQKSVVPTSNITSEAVMVDGVMLSQKDHAGVIFTASQSYTVAGMILTQTDARGNIATMQTDLAGRKVLVTDAAGNGTGFMYGQPLDQPTTVTDSLGNTVNYRYDGRGRKAAEWGTAIQPALFDYDSMDHLVSLTTFRAGSEMLSSDPGGRTDGDTTIWTYHEASGLEISKSYANGAHVDKTYNVLGLPERLCNARGTSEIREYDTLTGQLTRVSFSDGSTPSQTYTYNHLGQLIQVTDSAGTRTIGYNEYGEQKTDSLAAGGKTHLITETRDQLGRSTGYAYVKDGVVEQNVFTDYGKDGRISTAGFLHEGEEKQFGFSYLEGTNLLYLLTKPNGITFTQAYEEKRDLVAGMYYKKASMAIVGREYTYDALGRPLARSTSRKGTVTNDSFVYNTRSELALATVDGGNYSYDYDNIGNRKSAEEATEKLIYGANNLNQYTSIQKREGEVFVPAFDADGNQTLVKTSTGMWKVAYNAANRPVTFTKAEGNMVIIVTCTYDFMGRRATKKVEVVTAGQSGEKTVSVTLHQRYLYRGYLQIACCNLTRSSHPCMWLITWDPTEPVSTRPLAIQKDGTWYTYGLDLTKNVLEIFNSEGVIATIYLYKPYGVVTTEGSVAEPIQWSSEYCDDEVALVYYNYRYYNPCDGRWINKDPIEEEGGWNLFGFVGNSPFLRRDMLGLFSIGDIIDNLEYSPIRVSYKIPKFSKSAPLGPMGDGRFSFGGRVNFGMKLNFASDKSKFTAEVNGEYNIGISVSSIDKQINIGGMEASLRAGATVGNTAKIGISGSVDITRCPKRSITGQVCITGSAESYIIIGAKASLKKGWFDISVGAEIKGSLKLSYKQCRTFQGEGSTSQPSEITLTADATVYVYVFSNSLSVNLGKTSSKLPSSWAPQIL